MDRKRLLALCAGVVALGLFNGATLAQLPLPTRVEFAEQDLRALLPPDGKLIEEGQISKAYVGIALGRRVRARGKRVYVSDEVVGTRGVIFRDGYIEVNLGAHVEKEERVLFARPTFAVDVAVTAKVWITDDLKVHAELIWRSIQGDNPGGQLAVLFAKGRLTEMAEKEANRFAEKLSKQIQQKLPKALQVHVNIRPGTLVVVRGPRAKGEKVPVPKRRHFLCHEIDRCGHPALRVRGATEEVVVGKGETKEVRVQLDRDGWFYWYCGNSRERTRPSDRRTTFVVVTREPNGRRIDWYCYREE